MCVHPSLSAHNVISYRTAVRTTEAWTEEPKLPPLQNLISHITKMHADVRKPATAPNDTTPQPTTSSAPTPGFSRESAKLMEDFLAEGKLNPKQEPTRAGFLKIFSAWLLEEDLPWTTGEAPSLVRLFKYLQIKFMLPTDTTVRNTVAKLFADMHAEVVKTLTVSSLLGTSFHLG
jgi:hypothetical protein